MTKPPGLAPGCHLRQLLGPFEGEEEGIDIASYVVKVEGEDLATPDCLREDKVRRYVGESQSWLRTPWLAARKPRDRNDSPILV